jgi:hypothetical protein
MAAIDITYNHTIGNRSKHIDVAYHLVSENVESGQISLLQVESGGNLANIYPKGLQDIALQNLRTTIMDAKCQGMLDVERYFILLLFHSGYLFYIS